MYVFIMLFNATLLYKLRNGPSWPILADAERIACRNNWWTNMLYINNFFKTSEPVRITSKFRNFENSNWNIKNVRVCFVLFFFSVHATCLVFSSGLSVGHFRHHYPIGGMEIQQIHKTHFCSRFWHIIFHTSHYHVSKSIRRNLHGHTRVRFIQTKYPSIWPKQMGEKRE